MAVQPHVDEAISSAAAEAATRYGAQLIEVVVRGDRRRRVLEVYVDAEAGVTADRCADISRELMEIIDRDNLVESDYRLDVSSPGTERPLKFPWQYPKHLGRKCTVNLVAGSTLSGTLLEVNEAGISVQVNDPKQNVAVPFTEIARTIVEIPW